MVGPLATDRAASPAAAFEVIYPGPDGSRCHEPLSTCWTVPFETVAPVHSPGSFGEGRRGFAGWWWSATTAEHVGFASWVGRDQVMALDFDPTVVGLASRPFTLSWHADGETRSHTPDYFLRLRDGTAAVLDVRADEQIAPADEDACAATAAACESVGWQFQRVGPLDPVRVVNLRWLAGYRHPRCWHPVRAAALQRVFTDPAPLLEGVREVGDPIAVLPSLYHLLWRQVLEVDLDSAVLAGSSLVWCRP